MRLNENSHLGCAETLDEVGFRQFLETAKLPTMKHAHSTCFIIFFYKACEKKSAVYFSSLSGCNFGLNLQRSIIPKFFFSNEVLDIG